MSDVNHEGEASPAWASLKAKLKRLLTSARDINAAFDEGIVITAERQRQFEQDIANDADRLKAEREAANALPDI